MLEIWPPKGPQGYMWACYNCYDKLDVANSWPSARQAALGHLAGCSGMYETSECEYVWTIQYGECLQVWLSWHGTWPKAPLLIDYEKADPALLNRQGVGRRFPNEALDALNLRPESSSRRDENVPPIWAEDSPYGPPQS